MHNLRERVNDGELDATPLTVDCTECLVPSNYDANSSEKCALGYGALDIARNYCGADTLAGHEVVAASQLGGRVGIWVTLDPASNATKEVDTSFATDGMKFHKPDVEFVVPNATGTTIAIRPPTLGNYYSQESDVLLAVGCTDGSVVLCKSGILAAKSGAAAGTSGIVGDSSSTSNQVISIHSNSGGQIVATIGGGHACIMSIVWHPSIPNTFAVGRKDGSIDVYSSTGFDYEELTFRRMHRLMDSISPIRGLTFSKPEGMLLFAGDDGGKLYSYDASVASSHFNEHGDSSKAAACPIKLVACALTAHKGWIMNLTSFPDEKRVCSCGSDRAVKVWDCGMGLGSSMAVHSFDGVHSGWVWDVAVGFLGEAATAGGSGVSGGAKKSMLVSCGNDGVMQVFSCGD